MAPSVVQEVCDALAQQGYLLDLNVSRWAGQTRLTEEDLGLDGLTDSNLHRLGRMQLVPADELAKIMRIEQRARQALAHRSFKFPFGGARFVPEKMLGILLSELDRCRTEFNAAVESFVLDYGTMRRKMHSTWMENARRLQQELGKPAEWLNAFEGRLEAAYPSSEVVRRSFDIQWLMYQMALPQGLNVRLIDTKNAMEAARLADEARRNMEAQVQSFVGEAAQELRSRAASLCAHVSEQIGKNGDKLSEKSLNPLRELIAEFQAMDFTGDADFKATLDRLRSELLGGAKSGTAEALRGDANFREQFKQGLDAVVAKVEGEATQVTEEAVSRFLKFGRMGRAAAL